jgi:hypothetical protein
MQGFKMIMKRIIFYLLIGIVFLPLIQNKWHVLKIKPLDWSYNKEPKPFLTKKSFYTGFYQAKYEQYFLQNLELRPIFIRTHNQIQYSLYKTSSLKHIVIGKENFLYHKEFVRSSNGENYNGQAVMDYYVNSLKIIQDSLKKRYNIDLLVVLAPGKAYVYPEYIPEKYVNKKGPTNYEYYSKELPDAGVNTIDFNKYFKEIKDTSKALLFAAQGMHWSNYGAAIAFDSITKYIENKRMINLTDFKIRKIKYSEKRIKSEYDLEKGLNLLFELPHPKHAHPIIQFFPDDKNKDTCKVLTLSDSFFWSFYDMNFPQSVFTNWDFWYYGKDIVSSGKSTSTIDYEKEIRKFNVIILLATEASLTIDKFPYCFVERCLPIIYNTENEKK